LVRHQLDRLLAAVVLVVLAGILLHLTEGLEAQEPLLLYLDLVLLMLAVEAVVCLVLEQEVLAVQVGVEQEGLVLLKEGLLGLLIRVVAVVEQIVSLAHLLQAQAAPVS
jgi:hypothetical protein